jgi:hypothetical protein
MIGQLKALSTNVLHFQAYQVAATMATELDMKKDATVFRAQANALRRNVDRAYWSPSSHTYGYFKDEKNSLDGRWEALGSLLACRTLLSAACDEILAAAPIGPYGVPSVWPQYAEWIAAEKEWDPGQTGGYRHNGMVWPFLEAYAGWMAAREGRTDRWLQALGNLINLAGRDLTHRQFHHPQTGRGGGERGDLLSAAALVGLILRGALGIELGHSSMTLAPNLPGGLASPTPLRITGLRYRAADVNVTVRGGGRSVRSVKLNGSPIPRAELPADAAGKNEIEIELGSV